MGYRGIRDVPDGRRAARDMCDHMGILAQPAMTGDFEEIGSVSRIRHQNLSQKIPSMWRDIFWEGEWRRNYVLVQKVDVIPLGV